MSAEIIRWPHHIRLVCTCSRENHACAGCNLFTCATCRASEGELATECPGYRLHPDERASVYNGHLDYVRGRWQPVWRPALDPAPRHK